MIGRPELCDDPRYMDKDLAALPENILGIYNLLKEAFLTKPRAEWLQLSKEQIESLAQSGAVKK